MCSAVWITPIVFHHKINAAKMNIGFNQRDSMRGGCILCYEVSTGTSFEADCLFVTVTADVDDDLFLVPHQLQLGRSSFFGRHFIQRRGLLYSLGGRAANHIGSSASRPAM